MNRTSHLLLLISAISLPLVICGCGGQQAPPPPPPPQVTLSNPVERQVTKYLEYTGTTVAVESVDIRARVSGYLESILFQPRSKVKAGDILFIIDTKPYYAKVAQFKAALESKKAALRIREIELEKYAPLASKDVISGLKLDDVKANRDMAQAEVEQSLANLDAATLDLDYCHVRSPIDGRVGRNLVDVGNLVTAADNTLLASVVRDDMIYVYFSISETDLLKLTRNELGYSGKAALKNHTPAFMGLADETGYPRNGSLDYTDIKVDPNTGTIQVRAVFENRDGILYPGMFSRIRIPLDTRTALMVSDSAVMSDQGGKFVLLCNKDDVVEFRRVRTSDLVDDMRVIEDGLTATDRVIVNGTQKARPGGKVTPVQATDPKSAAPPRG